MPSNSAASLQSIAVHGLRRKWLLQCSSRVPVALTVVEAGISGSMAVLPTLCTACRLVEPLHGRSPDCHYAVLRHRVLYIAMRLTAQIDVLSGVAHGPLSTLVNAVCKALHQTSVL